MLAATSEKAFALKATLLAEGCGVADTFVPPADLHCKQIHLYAHSPHAQPIARLPEDVQLDDGITTARLRYQPDAPWRLDGEPAIGYCLRHRHGARRDVQLQRAAGFAGARHADVPLEEVVARLGPDVLGVTPANSCFYFATGDQCRFCELLPTFREAVAHRRARKSDDLLRGAVAAALDAAPELEHVAVTSGNVRSYDYTVQMYCALGEKVFVDRGGLGDVLATLMPPSDLTLLVRLRRAGFTRVYFPLEVFDPARFAAMCPGKNAYGYARILAALDHALEVFGVGNVFTNLIYGLQSFERDRPLDLAREHDAGMQAVESLLGRAIVPAFTVYHTSGHNIVGALRLRGGPLAAFFSAWGRSVASAQVLPKGRDAVLFGPRSLTNTLFNDGYALARSMGRRARRAPAQCLAMHKE